ncbi:MAG: DNA-processing protein DprA [Solirubrobacteraceae bacterium]
MSSRGGKRRAPGELGACAACLRRSWLLSALSGPLDCCARDRARLLELLALADCDLLAAVAGRRAPELRTAYERFDAGELQRDPQVQAICRHRRGYPHALGGPAAPHMLAVAGGASRLAKLAAAPVVAILGSRAPSDYGREMARSLARGLAASGVTVAAGLADGIAAAAHAGALDAGAGSVAVLGGGLGVSCPPRRRSLYERIRRAGCAVSELPLDCAGRRWGQLASERIVVGLGLLSVVVEAEQTPADLAAAGIARALGRTVAAIPGRVTSPLSRGAHALLMDGASLVRGPRDVLELLCPIGAASANVRAPLPAAGEVDPRAGLRPALKAVLERVGAGYDTPDKLARAGVDSRHVLPALGELELTGLVIRGDGGRYLPRDPLD